MFSNVIGQSAIKKRLLKSVREGRVPHAQLFAGASGTGALALAIAYAQYICCENRGEYDSCGVCPSCLKYSKLSHPDLHFVFPIVKNESKKLRVCDDYIREFRSAVIANKYITLDQWMLRISEAKQGNIYADEGDEIIRKLSLKSYESEYKVMIMWYSEKMNESCANKVLKILEEPPEKTVFIFVSEDAERMLVTIQSRLQRLNLPPIVADDINLKLQLDFELSDEERAWVVRNARGSWAKVLSLLEQSAQSQFFFEEYVKLFRLAWKADMREINMLIERLSKVGREAQVQFLQYMQQQIRENFMLRLSQRDLNYMNTQETAFASRFSIFVTEKNIEKLMQELALAEAHIDQNGNAKIVFYDLILKVRMLLKTA